MIQGEPTPFKPGEKFVALVTRDLFPHVWGCIGTVIREEPLVWTRDIVPTAESKWIAGAYTVEIETSRGLLTGLLQHVFMRRLDPMPEKLEPQTIEVIT